MRRRAFVWFAVVGLVCAAAALLWQRSGGAQDAPGADAKAGKFQIAISQSGPNIGNLVMCNTETGQVWYAISRTGEGWADWRAIKPPPAERR